MEALFLKLVNMSITASWLVLAVLILRLVLKKAPRYIHVILWGLVALRLIFPFSIESVLSLIPSAEPLPEEFLYAATPQINSGIPIVNNALNPVIAESLTPEGLTSANPTQIWSFIFAWLWVIGMGIMALYALISYYLVRRKVAASIPVGKNLRLCDDIDTPFILGIIKPKIYLPSALDQQTADHVLAHEYAHLKRCDHWWKPLGFALLTVYWFNPVMWLAYIFLCRDIEMACDEKVVRELGAEEKKAYSTALLSCSVPRRMIAACPLAFGEVGVKNRIKSVLNYKKPAFWIVVVAVIACIVVAVCFLTNPKDPGEEAVIDSLEIIEDITSENGYQILNQNPVDIRISIPKSALTDSIYSEEGQTFGVNEVVVYETGTTLFYLDSVRFANEGDDLLYFKFNSIYTPADSGTLTLLYYSMREGNSRYTLWVEDTTVTDDNKEYPDAVSIRGIDGISGAYGGTSFTVYVDTEVCKAAEGSINFTVNNFTDLTYARDSAGVSYENISDLTSTLTLSEIDRVQATLWTEPKQHIELTEEQTQELVGILNGLEQTEFERSNGVDHNITLMILCADKAVGLQSDGEKVWFLLDSETSENISGSWAVVNEELNTFINDINDAYANRLAPGTYVTSELTYWPPYSSWYWAEDPEYHYQVTEDGFYSEYEGETFEVDWQWSTVAESAEELMFFFEWYGPMVDIGTQGIPPFDSNSLYQKIDTSHHLFLIDGTLYLVEGYDTGTYLTNVSAIFRLEPYSDADVPVTYPDSANANETNNLYSTISGLVYDTRDGQNMLIRNAIMTNHNVHNSDDIFFAESHQILAELVACGAEVEDGSPVGYTVVDVIAVLMKAERKDSGVVPAFSDDYEIINATITIDEYADGTLKLSEYQENPDEDLEKYELTPLIQHCYDQAIKYWGLNTDLMADSLLDTISSSPAQYSNAQPYIEAHQAEYEKLVNLGEYTLNYCFREFLNGTASGIRAEVMAAACRDIGDSMGEDIRFEGQYVNGAGWFTAFHSNAMELFEANGLDTLAESNRASWVLLNILGQTPVPITPGGANMEIVNSEHHTNGVSLYVDVTFPDSVDISNDVPFPQSESLSYTSDQGETQVPSSHTMTESVDEETNTVHYHFVFDLYGHEPVDSHFSLDLSYSDPINEDLTLSWQADVDDAHTYTATSGDSEVTLTISPYVINVESLNLGYTTIEDLYNSITIWGKDGTIIPIKASHGGSSGSGLMKLQITLNKPVDIDNIRTIKVGGLTLK